MLELGDWAAVRAAVTRTSAAHVMRAVRYACRNDKAKLKQCMRTLGRAMVRAGAVEAALAKEVFEPRSGCVDKARVDEVLQGATVARDSPRVKNAGGWRGAPHAAPCGLMDVAHPPASQVGVSPSVLVAVASDYSARGDTDSARATRAALSNGAESAHARAAGAADAIGMIMPQPDARAEARARATLRAFDEARAAWRDVHRPRQFGLPSRHTYNNADGDAPVYAPVVNEGVRVRIARAGDADDAAALASPAGIEDVLVAAGSGVEVVVGPHDPASAHAPACGVRPSAAAAPESETDTVAFRPTSATPSHVTLAAAALFVDRYAQTLDISLTHALSLGPSNMRTECAGGGSVEFQTHPVRPDAEFDTFVHARSADDPFVRLAAALLVLTVPDMAYAPFLDVTASEWPSPSSMPTPATDPAMARAPPVVALAVRVLLDARARGRVTLSQLSDALRVPVTPRAWHARYSAWAVRTGATLVTSDADAHGRLADAIAECAKDAGTMTPYGFLVTAADAFNAGSDMYCRLLRDCAPVAPAYHPYTYLTPRALLAVPPCNWLGDGSQRSPLGAAMAALTPSPTTLPAFSDAIAALSARAAAAMRVPPGLSPRAASENANSFVMLMMRYQDE